MYINLYMFCLTLYNIKNLFIAAFQLKEQDSINIYIFILYYFFFLKQRYCIKNNVDKRKWELASFCLEVKIYKFFQNTSFKFRVFFNLRGFLLTLFFFFLNTFFYWHSIYLIQIQRSKDTTSPKNWTSSKMLPILHSLFASHPSLLRYTANYLLLWTNGTILQEESA